MAQAKSHSCEQFWTFKILSRRNSIWFRSKKLIRFLNTFIYLFIYFIFTLFDSKLRIYTKKSLYSLYSNNIELIDVDSANEREMQSFPKEFLKSLWTSWQTQTHLFMHWPKKDSKERLHSCAVSFLVFIV